MNGPSEQESAAKAKREADRAKALRANLRRRKAAGQAVSPVKANGAEDVQAD